MKARQGKAVRALEGERTTSLDQSYRRLVAVLGGLRLGRVQIGLRRLRVIGAVEVLGIKNRVALGEPFGSASVQCATATLE